MGNDVKRVRQLIDIKGIRDGLLIRVGDGPDVALGEALAETLAGKAVSTPSTRAYGCSVKYSSM